MDFDQLPILVVLFPLILSFIIPVLGWWKKILIFPLVVIVISLSLLSSFQIAFTVFQSGPIDYYLGGWDPPWGIAYRIDHLSAFMVILISTISLFVLCVFQREH